MDLLRNLFKENQSGTPLRAGEPRPAVVVNPAQEEPSPAAGDPVQREITEYIAVLKTGQRTWSLLGDPKERARKRLRIIGEPAVEPLIAAMRECRGFPLALLIASLAESGDPRAVDPLLAALSDSDEEVREAAAAALGKLGDRRAVEPLLAALSDNSQAVREAATWSLGAMGAERTEEPLLARLVKSDGTSLYDMVRSERKVDEESPILLKGTEALVYRGADGRTGRDDWAGRWILVVPTKCTVRKEWVFTLSPEQHPDRFIFEMLLEAEKRLLKLPLEGRLYRLMTAGQAQSFDYNRPIIIQDYAYLFVDNLDQRWHLRIPVDETSERDFAIPARVLTEDRLEETVLKVISSVGMSMMEASRNQ